MMRSFLLTVQGVNHHTDTLDFSAINLASTSPGKKGRANRGGMSGVVDLVASEPNLSPGEQATGDLMWEQQPWLRCRTPSETF